MTGQKKTAEPDSIKETIEAEEDGALTKFRSSRFGERLQRRIADQAATSPVAAGYHSALRPVWVSLAVLVILAAAAVWLLRARQQTIPGAAPVEAALHGLPGLEAIENPPRPLPRASSPTASPFEMDVTSVLSFSRGTGRAPTPGSARDRGFSAIDPASEPLGLRRVYEILVIDRSVERVLSDISTKTKEG